MLTAHARGEKLVLLVSLAGQVKPDFYGNILIALLAQRYQLLLGVSSNVAFAYDKVPIYWPVCLPIHFSAYPAPCG